MVTRITGCNLEVVIELSGRGNSIDTEAMEEAIENVQQDDVSVRVRPGRLDADTEIVVSTEGGIVLESQVGSIERAVEKEIIEQNIDFEVFEWYIQA